MTTVGPVTMTSEPNNSDNGHENSIIDRQRIAPPTIVTSEPTEMSRRTGLFASRRTCGGRPSPPSNRMIATKIAVMMCKPSPSGNRSHPM